MNLNNDRLLLDCPKTPSDFDVCKKPDKTETQLGWKGYCLEKLDKPSVDGVTADRPCLTWMPLDFLGGEQDSFNDYPPASSTLPKFDYFYCLKEQGNAPYLAALNQTVGATPGGNPEYIDLQPDGEATLWEIEDAGGETFEYTTFYEGEPGNNIHVDTIPAETALTMMNDENKCEWQTLQVIGRPVNLRLKMHKGTCMALFHIDSMTNPDFRRINKNEIEAIIFEERQCLYGSGCISTPVPVSLYEKDKRQVIFIADPKERANFYVNQNGYTGRVKDLKLSNAYWEKTTQLGNEELYEHFYNYYSDDDKGSVWYYSNAMYFTEATEFFNPEPGIDGDSYVMNWGKVNCLTIVLHWDNQGYLKQIDFYGYAVPGDYNQNSCLADEMTVGSSNYHDPKDIKLIPYIVYKDWCVDLGRVTPENNHQQSPVFTNRLWSNSGYQISELNYGWNSVSGDGNSNLGTIRGVPFGRAGIDIDIFNEFLRSEGKHTLPVQGVGEYTYSGTPYACVNTSLSRCGRGVCMGGINSGNDCSGSPADCPDGKCIGTKVAKGEFAYNSIATVENPAEKLQEIFAKSYAIYRFDTPGGFFTGNGWSRLDNFAGGFGWYKSESEDAWDLRRTCGISPVIRGVNSNGGEINSNIAPVGGSSSVPSRGISVNGSYDRQVAAAKQYWARINFFAYNDSGDQMPLRIIRMDWEGCLNSGDCPGGSADNQYADVTLNPGAVSSYQNYKEVCAGENFGDTADGCREKYFSFNYLYTYDPSLYPDNVIDNCSDYTDGTDYNGYNEECLVFKPRAQVVDNWGICGVDPSRTHNICWNDSSKVCLAPSSGNQCTGGGSLKTDQKTVFALDDFNDPNWSDCNWANAWTNFPSEIVLLPPGTVNNAGEVAPMSLPGTGRPIPPTGGANLVGTVATYPISETVRQEVARVAPLLRILADNTDITIDPGTRVDLGTIASRLDQIIAAPDLRLTREQLVQVNQLSNILGGIIRTNPGGTVTNLGGIVTNLGNLRLP
ncbi:MAG: hypothetical protein WC268_04605 [Patescibacteria group bacterium]|jgi:hypothetical protein